MQAMMSMPFLFRFRDALATLPAMLMLAILVFAGIQKVVKIEPHPDDSLVQIALTEPEQPAPPVVVPPPTPTPPQIVKPLPVAQPVRQPTPPQAVSAAPVSSNPSPEMAARPRQSLYRRHRQHHRRPSRRRP